MKRAQIIVVFFIVFFLFMLYNVFLILSPFFQPIFWATVLAFAFHPIYRWLKHKMGGSDKAAAFVTTFTIFLVFVPLVVFLILSLTEEAVKLYKWVTLSLENGEFQRMADNLRSKPYVERIEAGLDRVHGLKQNIKTWIPGLLGAMAQTLGRQTGMITKNVFIFLINFLLTFFLVFFLLKDGHKVYHFIYDITPMEERNKKKIFRQLDETFSAVLRGQLITGLVQALIAGMVFWLLDLPLPVFFAALTFLVALIPVLGAATVWFPFVIYLVAVGRYGGAVTLFLVGALIISLVDNVLKPILIGEKTRLPYFLLFLGILGGLQVYGLTGVFLAPAVLSVSFVLIKIYREKFSE